MILPGQDHQLNDDERECPCEAEGCTRDARLKIAGEVDSLGIEWRYYCDIHGKAVTEQLLDAPNNSGVCEWCKKESSNLRPRRDISEGSGGPVYEVCPACIDKDEKLLQEELDSYED